MSINLTKEKCPNCPKEPKSLLVEMDTEEETIFAKCERCGREFVGRDLIEICVENERVLREYGVEVRK